MPINRIESGVPPTKNKYIIDHRVETSTVNSGSSKTLEFSPPAGKLWEILNMRLEMGNPTGASSGTHSITLRSGDITTGIPIIKGGSVFNSNLIWTNSIWKLADSIQEPASDIAALYALSNTHIILDTPLHVQYSNDTDVNQIKLRSYVLSFLETSLI